MQFADVEFPSKMEDGHICSFFSHDVEEVQSAPYVKELKEEEKIFQNDTFWDEWNGEHAYASYL